MRVIKKILATALCAFLAFTAPGQTVGDALRYSQFTYGGTARFIGSGSAMGPIGADFGAISTNPASVGLFRRNEAIFTPSVIVNNADAQLITGGSNPMIDDYASQFNIQNFGIVFTSRPRRSPKWKQVNFAIGFNHQGNFNSRFEYQGRSAGSLTESFQEAANDFGIDQIFTGPALDAGAIYDFDDNGVYDIDYELTPTEPLLRGQTVESAGSLSELTFSFGANYDEVLIIGVTLGVPIFTYDEERLYFEQDENGNVPFFVDLAYQEDLRTTGTGINGKLGLIYKPIQMLRIGASVHTPTRYSLEDDFSNQISYNFFTEEDDSGEFVRGFGESPQGFFDYNLSTPWRFLGGVGLIFGKNGFLTSEVEFVDYSGNNFDYNGAGGAEQAINNEISNTLASVLNVRIGGEYAYNKLRLRAGLGILPSPFENDDTTNLTYSGGLGYRGKRFFADLAYRNQSFTQGFRPYVTEFVTDQFVETDFDTNFFVLSLGAKF